VRPARSISRNTRWACRGRGSRRFSICRSP
jgi:hypothetical protein